MNYAWPTSEIAVMGAKGAAEIIFRREILEAEDRANGECAAIARRFWQAGAFRDRWIAGRRGDVGARV